MEGEWKRGNANEEDGRGTMWEEKWREGRGREGVKAVGRPLLALRAVGRPLVKITDFCLVYKSCRRSVQS